MVALLHLVRERSGSDMKKRKGKKRMIMKKEQTIGA